ncbi:neuromedin-U receptor 2 [Neophocaena asiaeorientalis asiaeorientalis]|uniref:Neuromedin-U receptor 2 n=1 Tax=Neophocaena asiaeorientalis asiaeorientalis TaxID=1706337 RepID=A0A341B4A7_NEOAA|nr:neuromedin-U receptor 2 [Neophocaena asiaeorientalis asiaeorientalis]
MEKHENDSWIYQKELEDPFKKYLNNTDDYLALLCGPPRSHLFLSVSVVYTLIFVVGVAGNLLVCLVILRHQTMKTPTNYYLFSLAVSDLLVLLLGMPLEVYEMWRNYPFLFGPVGCYFKTALFETVCFASVLSITAVSMERYVAILHPFRAKLESTRRRALRILSLVWGFSVLFSLPNTSIHGIELRYFPNGSFVPGSATCTIIKPMWIYSFIIQVTSFLFYILPMMVISVLYYLMGLKLKKDQPLEADEVTANIQRPSRKSVTKMLFVLVLAFAICWAPFHIDRLFFSFVEEWTESLAAVFNLIHVVSGVLFYLSSAVNPIIYNLLSRRFRAAFRNVLTPSCKQRHSQNHPQGPSVQQNIRKMFFLMSECHLVELTEDVGPQFPCQLSICSSHFPTALCAGQALRKELSKS